MATAFWDGARVEVEILNGLQAECRLQEAANVGLFRTQKHVRTRVAQQSTREAVKGTQT